MVLSALFLPMWSFLVLAVLYGLVWTPYELLILALCIDAQFGDQQLGVWYWYTLWISCILVFSVYIRPHVRFYH